MNYVTHKQLEDFCTKHSKLKPTINLPRKENPFSSNSLVPVAFEIDKIKDALAVLDPDDSRGNAKNIDFNNPNGTWLSIVWACASLNDSRVKELLRDWSKQSNKYDEVEFEKAYTSYNPHYVDKNTGDIRPIGIGTLYKLAKPKDTIVENNQQSINQSDVANGRHMAEMFRGLLCSVRDTPMWIFWEHGKGWAEGDSTFPMKAAKVVLDDMRQRAAKAVKEGQNKATKMVSEVARTGKANNMQAMIKMCESELEMNVGLDELDKDPLLLGVNNGVFDLKTMSLLPPDPKILVVKRANVHYDPKADAPRFRRFLEEVSPEKDLRLFLVRLLGYLLTGSIKEHRWFFFVGEGRNGKSLLMRVMEKIMGDYAKKVDTEMLMKSNARSPGSASPDVLQLQGKRFIYGNETREGQRLDDAKIKDMTGGDTLTGRALHSNHYVQFDPTHKLVITGNHYPSIHDDSYGFWERVVVFPFNVTFSKEQIDKDLEEKLLAEKAGILNILLEGADDWHNNGLQVPEKLISATNKYRSDQDVIKQFLDEECTVGVEHSVSKKTLYLHYSHWAKENGSIPLSSRRFSGKLTKNQFKVMDDQRTWQGLTVKIFDSADLQTN